VAVRWGEAGGEVGDRGGAGEVEGVFGDVVAVGEGGDDLGAFDGVDAEVGFEVQVGFDDVAGVSGGCGEGRHELRNPVGGVPLVRTGRFGVSDRRDLCRTPLVRRRRDPVGLQQVGGQAIDAPGQVAASGTVLVFQP
jgi:hypothetical protein